MCWRSCDIMGWKYEGWSKEKVHTEMDRGLGDCTDCRNKRCTHKEPDHTQTKDKKYG